MPRAQVLRGNSSSYLAMAKATPNMLPASQGDAGLFRSWISEGQSPTSEASSSAATFARLQMLSAELRP